MATIGAAASPILEGWRLFFPTTALLAVAGLGAWGAQLAGAPLGVLPRDHGAFMVWGVLGGGIFGFLTTAYPKQNEAPLPTNRLLLPLWGAQIVGALGLLLGFPWFAMVSWAVLLGWLGTVAVPSLKRRWEPTTAAVPVAVFSGLVGLLIHATGGNGTLVGVHAFVTPLALAILDRVLPFFAARVTPGYTGRRLPWFIGPVLALSWLRLTPLDDLATGGLLLLLLRQWWGWRPFPSVRTPMIAVLHLGVVWIAGSWVLGWVATPSIALHALVIGGLGSLLLGISMRVVRGHGGLPLVLGPFDVTVIGLAQLAAVLRISGLPVVYAAVALGCAFAVWFSRFALTCWRVTPAR